MIVGDLRINQENLYIREMCLDDIESVIEIENGVNPFPWSVNQFRAVLDHLHYMNFVLIYKKQIIGFFMALILTDEAEILNMAINIAYQGKGLGTFLLSYALHFLESKKARTIFLEVRESNAKAQALYKKMGFLQISIRKKYYQSNHQTENAIIMRRT